MWYIPFPTREKVRSREKSRRYGKRNSSPNPTRTDWEREERMRLMITSGLTRLERVDVDIEPGIRYWKGVVECQVTKYYPRPEIDKVEYANPRDSPLLESGRYAGMEAAPPRCRLPLQPGLHGSGYLGRDTELY